VAEITRISELPQEDWNWDSASWGRVD